MDDKPAVAITIILTVLAIVGVGMVVYRILFPTPSNVFEVEFSEEEMEHTLSFTDLAIIPGDKSEYSIKVGNYVRSRFDLHLSFNETMDGTLDQFLRVRISANDRVLTDQRLCEMFAMDSFDIPFSLDNGETFHLTITYYMPSDVSNEAQNAETAFDLVIKATD